MKTKPNEKLSAQINRSDPDDKEVFALLDRNETFWTEWDGKRYQLSSVIPDPDNPGVVNLEFDLDKETGEVYQ